MAQNLNVNIQGSSLCVFPDFHPCGLWLSHPFSREKTLRASVTIVLSADADNEYLHSALSDTVLNASNQGSVRD